MVRVVDELVALRVLESEDGRWRLRRPLDEIARAVPESLRLLVEKQVARLEPEAQRLLEAASVLGSEFTVPSIAAGLAKDPLAVEECCDALARQGQFLAASALYTRPDGTQVRLVLEKDELVEPGDQYLFFAKIREDGVLEAAPFARMKVSGDGRLSAGKGWAHLNALEQLSRMSVENAEGEISAAAGH